MTYVYQGIESEFDVAAGLKAGRDVIGLPFEHQGRNAELALDCSGLLLHMYHASGWKALAPEITYITNYNRISSWKDILRFLNAEAYRISIADVLPLDLLLVHFTNTPIPQHFAMVTEVKGSIIYIIHTHHVMPEVKEHHLSSDMYERIHSVWRVKGRVVNDPLAPVSPVSPGEEGVI